jgi:hypothetical protein
MSDTFTQRAEKLRTEANAVGKMPMPFKMAAAAAMSGRVTDLIIEMAQKLDALTVGEGG